jgi:hypothetical protein
MLNSFDVKYSGIFLPQFELQYADDSARLYKRHMNYKQDNSKNKYREYS